MSSLISLNGTIASAVPRLAASNAMLYGKGVFTTIAIYDRQPFQWDRHIRRLNRDSKKLGIDLSEISEDELKASLAEVIKVNGIGAGRSRFTFFDESQSELWPLESERKTSVMIMTADFRPVPENFKLAVSPHLFNSTSPLVGVKSCNYLEKIIAKDEAKHRGFDEAIQLNELGHVSSACMANVFWLKDEKMFTPSLMTGCLPGTTREFILENLDCEEVEVGIQEIKTADEIFLTSAGIGVAQVAEFDGKKLRREGHAITKLIPPR